MSVGFYGKLPSHGDFLHRAVSDTFVNRWDAWLQEALASLRSELGDSWIDIYLTSPVWRFAFGSGVVGAACWAGMLLPSVDRVGRCFPLTIVAELAPGVFPFEVSVVGNGWYDWAETAARRALEEDVVDLRQLETGLRDSETLLGIALPGAGTSPALSAAEKPTAPIQSFTLNPDGDMGRFFARFAQGLAGSPADPLALWWSVGSDRVVPTVLLTRGLPPASVFPQMIAGGSHVDARITAPLPQPREPGFDPTATTIIRPIRVIPPPGPHFASAGVTDVGHWREENEDAWLERTDAGLWAVADGLGGHEGGAVASQLIVKSLSEVTLGGDLPHRVEVITAALRSARQELQRRSLEQPHFDGGSTLVLLCAHDTECAVLWAGDSRLYLLRDGHLQQITTDHSPAAGKKAVEADSNLVTRAIGAASELELEERRLPITAGDRYLLCSDGLYNDLTEAEIAHGLDVRDCATAASELLSLALTRGGRDNITAVIVEVVSSGARAADTTSL